MSILTEAEALINGDRQEAYGSPAENLQRIAEQWMLYLAHKYGYAQEDIAYAAITAEDVCWMMTLLKMSRQVHQPKRDNVADAIGYLALIEKVQ